jgi:arsenate-mycothiol transferase
MTTPSVLFVCVKNGGKSQMAAGLMRKAVGDSVQVHSAGTEPGSAVNALSAEALLEVGVDLSGEVPKPIDPALLARMDYVVTLGGEAKVDVVRIRELGHRRTLRTRYRRHRADASGA